MRRFAILRIIHLSIGYTMLHRPRDIMPKFILFATLSILSSTSALAADPTGDWLVAEPNGVDEHNPDVSKRSRPTLGIAVLSNMKKKPGVDQWEGEVYNANDGKTYSSTIKPVGSDKLEIQGCVLGFLCGGETWTRIAGPIPSSPSNSLAKGAKPPVPPKTTGTMAAAPKTPAAAPAAGQKQAAAPAAGQKQAAATPAAPADVGDICLLPDIARFAH
jgi:hypothetical protein